MGLQIMNISTSILAKASETILRARVCYGIPTPGKSIMVVRSSRSSGGSIRHTTIYPSDKTAWQQFLDDIEKPRIISVGCLPVQESLTLWLLAPFSSKAKAIKVFPSLLDIKLPFPLENCLYDFPDVQRMPDNTTRALAVAARWENIKSRLKDYQSQGLDPVFLDHEGLALWTQSIREMPLPPEVTRIILYLDSDHTTVVIGKGAQFLNAHSMRNSTPVPSNNAAAKAVETIQGPGASADALAEQIQRFLYAEVKPGTPFQWLVCGPGARNHSLIDTLHDRFAKDRSGPLTPHQEPESFLGRALNTRALCQGPLRCNFRGADLTHTAILDTARRQALTGALLFLITAVLLCGINAGWLFFSSQRLTEVKQAVAISAGNLAPDERIPYGQELREAGKAMDRQSELAEPFLNAFTPSLSARLKDVINSGKECQLTFETLSLRKNNVSISGTAEDWDQCEQFTTHLKKMGYSVTLERQEAVADTLVHFSAKGDTSP